MQPRQTETALSLTDMDSPSPTGRGVGVRVRRSWNDRIQPEPAGRTTQSPPICADTRIPGAPPAAHNTRTKKWRSRPISRVLSETVIPLGAASPQRSSSLPGCTTGRGIASLFGLAPSGVCRAGPLPDSRCALTAPFHPCRPACAVLGGIFLLHFPSARAAQALPGTLPCGARTFLDIPKDGATVWPTSPCAV